LILNLKAHLQLQDTYEEKLRACERPKKAENESKTTNVFYRRLSLFKNAHFHSVFKMKTTSIKNILYLNFYS